MANYETMGVKTDCWQHSSVKIPEKRWFNIIWYFNGRKNLMKIWIDGNEIKEISVTDSGEGCINNDLNGKWKFPVFENVKIGWVDYQPKGGTRSLWIDDFKLSRKQIKFKKQNQ
jgi:hypothetical protein